MKNSADAEFFPLFLARFIVANPRFDVFNAFLNGVFHSGFGAPCALLHILQFFVQQLVKTAFYILLAFFDNSAHFTIIGNEYRADHAAQNQTDRKLFHTIPPFAAAAKREAGFTVSM